MTPIQYKRHFYQIVEWNQIEQSIRHRESNRIDFFHESECSCSEFQTDGAENRKARLEKSVLVKVRPAARWQMNVKFGCSHVPKI